jgi:2-oxo-4-hydroxy-4-carboxy--5-ureidoimidazoline (OHCU) decarboxylase
VHDLPRQLDRGQLAELFEGDTALVRALAERDDPLGEARAVIASLSEEEKLEALNAHPPIGARTGLSARSAAEQGDEADPEVLAELARLNREYEQRFGFRFVVFVSRRPKSAILEVLRARLERTREEELDTALAELVAIAEDRWRHSFVTQPAGEAGRRPEERC